MRACSRSKHEATALLLYACTRETRTQHDSAPMRRFAPNHVQRYLLVCTHPPHREPTSPAEAKRRRSETPPDTPSVWATSSGAPRHEVVRPRRCRPRVVGWGGVEGAQLPLPPLLSGRGVFVAAAVETAMSISRRPSSAAQHLAAVARSRSRCSGHNRCSGHSSCPHRSQPRWVQPAPLSRAYPPAKFRHGRERLGSGARHCGRPLV